MSVLCLNLQIMCAKFHCIMSWVYHVCFKKLHLIKFGAFVLDTVSKFALFFGVRFERRNVDKKANLHENSSIQDLF